MKKALESMRGITEDPEDTEQFQHSEESDEELTQNNSKNDEVTVGKVEKDVKYEENGEKYDENDDENDEKYEEKDENDVKIYENEEQKVTAKVEPIENSPNTEIFLHSLPSSSNTETSTSNNAIFNESFNPRTNYVKILRSTNNNNNMQAARYSKTFGSVFRPAIVTQRPGTMRKYATTSMGKDPNLYLKWGGAAAALGLVGWWLYHRNQKKTTVVATSTKK